jgi:Flp pilus assembly pilin Flp
MHTTLGHTTLGQRLKRLVRDERGQDLVEYALLTGIIAIGWVLVGTPIKGRMKNAYENWNANANSLWVTPPPTP